MLNRQQLQLQAKLDIANQFIDSIDADKTNYQRDLAAVNLQAANLLADADDIDTLYNDVILAQGNNRTNPRYQTKEIQEQIIRAKSLADEARKVFAREDGITIPFTDKQILQRTISPADKAAMIVGLNYALISIYNPLDIANTQKLKALRDDLRENGKDLGKESLAPKIIAGVLIGVAVLAVAALVTLSLVSAGVLTAAMFAAVPFIAKLVGAGAGMLGVTALGVSGALGSVVTGAAVSGAAVGFTAAGVTGTALGVGAAVTLAKNESGVTKSTATLFSNNLTLGKKGKEMLDDELAATDTLAKASTERVSFGA